MQEKQQDSQLLRKENKYKFSHVIRLTSKDELDKASMMLKR